MGRKTKSKAPILIFHGTADWRILPGSSFAAAKALQQCRHPYRLVMLEGSDHSLSEHAREVYASTKTWLDKYVRDKEPSPDLKPHGR